MHVQFFLVYVLTCGAQNFRPAWGVDLTINSSRSHNALLIEYDLYDESGAAGVSQQPDL